MSDSQGGWLPATGAPFSTPAVALLRFCHPLIHTVFALIHPVFAVSAARFEAEPVADRMLLLD